MSPAARSKAAGTGAEAKPEKEKKVKPELSEADRSLASTELRGLARAVSVMAPKEPCWLHLSGQELVVRATSGGVSTEVRVPCEPGAEASSAPGPDSPLEIAEARALGTLLNALATAGKQLGLHWDPEGGQLVLRAGPRSRHRLKAVRLHGPSPSWPGVWDQSMAGVAGAGAGGSTVVGSAVLRQMLRAVQYARSRAESDGWMTGTILDQAPGKFSVSATNRFQVARVSLTAPRGSAPTEGPSWQLALSGGAPEQISALCAGLPDQVRLAPHGERGLAVRAAQGHWAIYATSLSQQPGSMLERLLAREPVWQGRFPHSELLRVFAGASIVEAQAQTDDELSTDAWFEEGRLHLKARTSTAQCSLQLPALESSGEAWEAGLVPSMTERALRLVTTGFGKALPTTADAAPLSPRAEPDSGQAAGTEAEMESSFETVGSAGLLLQHLPGALRLMHQLTLPPGQHLAEQTLWTEEHLNAVRKPRGLRPPAA